MAIELVTGPANSGKARLAMEAVRRHLARGRDPILVVPTRADVDHYRLQVAREGWGMGVRIERFGGLIEEIVSRGGDPPLEGTLRAGDGRSGVQGAARAHLLAIAARQTWPAAAMVASPGFVRTLASTVDDLYGRRITAARLRAALDAQRPHGDGPPLGGDGRRHDGVAAGIEEQRPDRVAGGILDFLGAYERILTRIGRLDRTTVVTRAIDRVRASPALWRATPVIFYGFDDLTALQLDVVDALGRGADAGVMVALSYEPGRVAFAGRAGIAEDLIAICDRHERLPARSEYYAPRSRAALAGLERHLFESEPPIWRVDPQGAVRLLEGGDERTEMELVAREIRALIEGGIAAGEIAVVHRQPAAVADVIGEVFDTWRIPHGVRRTARFAQTALGRGLGGLIAAACGGLDQTAEGTSDDLIAWLRSPGLLRQGHLADELELTARRAGAATASETRTLWEADHWPLDALDRLRDAALAGPGELIDACEDHLERIFLAPRAGAATVLRGEERLEASALTCARVALGQLRELAEIDPSLGPNPRELMAILSELDVTVEDDHDDGRVEVVGPLALRARRVRVLFLCGLQEGVFPARVGPQPFFADRERASVVTFDSEQVLAMERHLLYATVSRPEELLYLSWHAQTDDGRVSPRSLFVDDVCDLLCEGLLEDRLALHVGASPPALATRSLADRVTGESTGRSRRGDEDIEVEIPGVWSPSSLETWASCPVRWLVERRLRARDLDPEGEPLSRGAVAHEALKLTLQRLRDQTGSARLSPATVTMAKKLVAEAVGELTRQRSLSVHHEHIPGAIRRLTCDLQRYIDLAGGQDIQLEPTHLELAFGGFGGSEDTPALDVGEGILVRGRIDRVDVGAGGRAVVYDYKSSRATAGQRWIEDQSFQVALYMRAVSELFGYEVVAGLYQPLSGRDMRPRGVVREGVGLDRAVVRTDIYDEEAFREIVEETVRAARQTGVEAARGDRSGRPDTCGYYRGQGCRYPTICRHGS